MNEASDRAVVVGIDGSAASLASIALAAREANLRGRSLRLVYADPRPAHPVWVDVDPVGPLADDLRTNPEQIVKEAAEHAGTIAAVPVSAEVVPGEPSVVLVRESRSAELMVVCHRGAGGFLGLRLGSVAIKVAAHSRCPVVVVRGTPAPGGCVLAGIDPATAGSRAVGFAFREAALHSTELLALHAWPGPDGTPFDGPGTAFDGPGTAPAREADGLAAVLKGWTDRYPRVPVRREVRRSRPAGALVAASERAQLVVVGTRGRTGRPALPFGTVTHALLHHAACPVAVVPPNR